MRDGAKAPREARPLPVGAAELAVPRVLSTVSDEVTVGVEMAEIVAAAIAICPSDAMKS